MRIYLNEAPYISGINVIQYYRSHFSRMNSYTSLLKPREFKELIKI